MLFAHDAVDEEPANVGVALSDDGNVVGLLDEYAGTPPRLWIEQN